MYTIPDALRITAGLTSAISATMIRFKAEASTAEIGEAWTLAVSAEEDTKKSLETAQGNLKAAGSLASQRAHDSAQSRAMKRLEATQDELQTAGDDRDKLEKELKQCEVRNAELKKKDAADLLEAKHKKKEKKTSTPKASKGHRKIKEGEPVDGILRDMPCTLCEHGGFACYNKTEAKGRACVVCGASKQPCFIPATGALKAVLNGIMERLDSKKRKALKAAASTELVEIEDDDNTGPSKKRRKVKKSKSGPQVVESEIEDEGAAGKEKQGEKKKGKEKEKEKEKTPKGLMDETMWGD
ncbi:hypothetical protein AURDEDRAFT_161066 [Auricularia subglabra TFB-10046 SS5]|nr:hypothetical protein AURDEDRAFT_161066 [Auricularia subglabra TFB-10046 SS5]